MLLSGLVKNFIKFYICMLAITSQAECAAIAESVLNVSYLQKLLQNMNTSVEPCADFYQYACGNWAQNYMTTDYEYVDMPGYMDYKVNNQLLALLEAHKHELGIYTKLWNYYRSCADLREPAANVYLELVQQELQFTWPIFREDWTEPWENVTQFDWLRIVAGLRFYGLNGVFIMQNIDVPLSNGSHYLLELHQHQIQAELFYHEVADIFLKFGLTDEETSNYTAGVIALEEQMKNLILMLNSVYQLSDNETEDIANREYKNNFEIIKVIELQQKVPQIDWQKYFNIILEREVNADAEMVQMLAMNWTYFTALHDILNNTPNETIANYIMLKLMYKLYRNLPNNGRDNRMHCIKELRGSMSLAVNFVYETHKYRSKRRTIDAALQEIYEKLRVNFRLLLDENHLGLNATEQAFVLQELKGMQMKIGNIPQPLTQQHVEEYYASVSINSSDFYVNNLQLLKLNTRKQVLRLRNTARIAVADKFYEQDAETAASSSPVKIFDNAIVVPYGYLQLPFFHHELQPLFQYSLFGFILAHEIIHAFDMFHIVYDQYGNYNDMGFAVAQHFANYISCSENLNSISTISENMADIAGIRLAYQTYFDEVSSHLPVTNTFGTHNFTSQQLFFINSVQFLCADMPKISTFNVRPVDIGHDVHDRRVLQNWAQFEQFAAAFQCENATNMHPVAKCRLW